MWFNRSLIALSFFLQHLISFSQTHSDSVYHINAEAQYHHLAAASYVFTDSANSIPANDIIAGKFDNAFKPFSSFSGELRSYVPYWIKFTVVPSADISDWWLWIRNDTATDAFSAMSCYADVYFVDEKGKLMKHEQGGSFVPRSRRSIKDKAGITRVPFSAAANQLQTAYIRIYNEFDIASFRMPVPQLKQPVLGVPKLVNSDLLYILCAIALIFSVMSFFFYFFVKERSYLFFGLYTLLLSQHYLILHPEMPFANMYIPEHPHWSYPFFQFLTRGSFLFFLWFGDSFINLKSLSPKTHRYLMWFIAVWGAVIVIETLFMGITHRIVGDPYVLIIGLSFTLGFIVRLCFFRNTLSWFFVAGALWLFLFTLVGVFNDYYATLPFNPWPIGQVGQLIIFSAGLAYKVRLNEKARAEAERIKEMDDIKSKFFANISHEFRTPLTLIQGPLQQIEEQNPGVKQQGVVEVPFRQLKTMRRNTDRLLELVNQLLDLSKLDAGNMQLQVVKGDAVQLLAALTASFESMAERKQIHYHTHFPELPGMLFFDKDKLEKIFVNLLANAFKYTPEKGTVSVTVSMEENRLRISVEDNGPGIPKKELDKVFDRFYQVESTGDKGSGIGLALVKELVDLYRGQITVSSEPGKGSRFKVSLQVEKSAFTENEFVYGHYEATPVFVDRSVETTTVNNEPRVNKDLPLLLIVEDNADLSAFIREIAAPHYQVEQAPNGKEGLEKAIALVPDIIVSDVMMPVMDGFAMATALKKDERSSHIPVILLTAKAGQQHKIEGLETGADDYLSKPFDAKELLARLDNLVNQRKLLRKKFAGTIQLKPSEVSVKSIDEIFLANTMKAIEKNMDDDEFGVEELAKQVAMSRSQLHRKLIALLDQSPSDLIRQTRLLRAKELLQKKAATPSEVAFKVGFSSHTYFSKCFKEEFGISPSEVV